MRRRCLLLILCVCCLTTSAQFTDVKKGDIIEIDITNGKLTVELSDEEIKERIANADLPEKKVKGWLNIYRRSVSSADEGAILR